jgi:DNA-binding protein H-NS
MNTVDISTLTIPELKGLQSDVAKLIEKRNTDAKSNARAQIAEIAKNAGINLKDLVAKGDKGDVKKAPIKFRDPTDANNTWSGRGRLPNWALKMKEAGTLDSARV